ncbi:hypothetical protein [Streptomyces sp. NBC_00280]|uniref:hypothetical protein n=1 Tax=Streptomyces sp. NBC_00280 TaxID=2975699 RepID=UPI00324A09F1
MSRCPAALPDDPSPCDGRLAVTVLDIANAGADGCELHGIRLLAALEGGRAVSLPDAPAGAAVRVHRSAGTSRADQRTASLADIARRYR